MSKPDKTRELFLQLISDLSAELELQERIDQGQSFLLGADGRFLGKIADPEDPESLLNPHELYGNDASSHSIFNVSSPYRSPEGEYSLKNPCAGTPPLLYISGEFWGIVSDNNELDFNTIPSDKFIHILRNDWRSFEKGEFSDSGSIRVQVPHC